MHTVLRLNGKGKGFTGDELVDLAGLTIWNNGSGQS